MTRLIILLFIPFLIQAQGINDNYLLKKMSISEVRAFENKLNSTCLGFKKSQVGEGFFKNVKEITEYQVIVYKRSNDDFNPVGKVEYYYNPTDSMIFGIVQDWDIMQEINLLKDTKIIEQQTKREKEYIDKYDLVKKEITEVLGSASQEIHPNADSDGTYGESKWIKNDKEIKLSVSFTPKLQESGPYKFGTFRIRLKTEFNL